MTVTALHPMTRHRVPVDIAVTLIEQIDTREPDALARLVGVLQEMVGEAEIHEAIRRLQDRRGGRS